MRPEGPLEVPSQGPWRWAGARPQSGGGELDIVPGGGGHPGGRGPACGPPAQEGDPVEPEPKGTHATAALVPSSVLNFRAGGPGRPCALSHRTGREAGRAGGAGQLGPAAEPWRRVGSGPPPQASDSKGATRPQQGKAGLPLAPPPPRPAFSTEHKHAAPAPGSRQGTLGRSNPPAPYPGEAEAIKGRARVAGAQSGAELWACSVRINCWMTGWTRESRKG